MFRGIRLLCFLDCPYKSRIAGTDELAGKSEYKNAAIVNVRNVAQFFNVFLHTVIHRFLSQQIHFLNY